MLSARCVENFRAYMMRANADPQGAYDALPYPTGPQLRIADFEAGGALDTAEEGAMLEPSDVAGVAAWCKKNLDLKQLGELVARLTDGDMAADDSRRRTLARDARTPSRPTEKQRAAFAKRFPEVAGVRVL